MSLEACLVLLLAIISRVFQMILVKLSIWFFVCFFLKFYVKMLHLGFLLQSEFVCKGGLVNSHNYLTNGA